MSAAILTFDARARVTPALASVLRPSRVSRLLENNEDPARLRATIKMTKGLVQRQRRTQVVPELAVDRMLEALERAAARVADRPWA